VYCQLGEIQRERNDLEGAEKTLHHALSIADDLSSGEFINDGMMSLAQVQAARGEYEAALATLDELRHVIRTQQLASWDVSQVEIVRVRILIAQGNIAEAAGWAQSCLRARQSQDRPLLPPMLYELEDLALARVALAREQPEDITAPLEGLCAAATTGGRLRSVMEAKMLLTRARWMTGDPQSMRADLTEALALAAPEGFTRLFLDEGEQMADLLQDYVASTRPSRERSYAATLLAAFGRAATLELNMPGGPLSPRELDVLRLLAAGHSNEVIAGELVVAISTVKWHVAHIYRKLGVTGRVQLVTRARELGLIA
jgi:LuxR family maltose regulon positive regulatory protein